MLLRWLIRLLSTYFNTWSASFLMLLRWVVRLLSTYLIPIFLQIGYNIASIIIPSQF